jgi:hypothetical protein
MPVPLSTVRASSVFGPAHARKGSAACPRMVAGRAAAGRCGQGYDQAAPPSPRALRSRVVRLLRDPRILPAFVVAGYRGPVCAGAGSSMPPSPSGRHPVASARRARPEQ